MSFRKEKKYRLDRGALAQVRRHLEEIGAKRLFFKRSVNSCYFDNFDFRSYWDSEEGLLPRKKIRLRWYDADTEHYSREIKFSSIEGRFKTSASMEGDVVSLIDKKRQIVDSMYGIVLPTILIKYDREYFHLGNLRFTLDNNITYTGVERGKNALIKDNECVLEVKAEMSLDESLIEDVFPQPTSRFSKYCRGMQFSKLI